ncbi:spondin domain-containing protein [Alkalimarinus sediminis]|uniref:Spondin domain-containing protein n=1 Tax=Alkalimarinus sediminis TaxID=1632866 RepID=A0A9E8HLQ0_9ALTE|nr:spondin domain-containing protein [Alkalimarinus sediminis]UZW75181.1 spondin domain-containing protein [Alkalimarinus sediminis]
MKTKSITTLSALPLLLASHLAMAQTVDVEVTNLTQGMYFTPLLVSAHDSATHLFEAGQSATAELQAMAEGGDISGLAAATVATGAVNSENPASGLLAPSTSTLVSNLDTQTNTHLSVVGMLLPTNDAFVGLNGWEIPQQAGTYTVYLNAYDAGTEANDEIVNGGGAPGAPGIPANPGGNGGTGATGVTATETNQTVHIHRGNVGDTDLSGGVSDVDSRIHRWLNPVAKVVVTVK